MIFPSTPFGNYQIIFMVDFIDVWSLAVRSIDSMSTGQNVTLSDKFTLF